MTTDNQIDDYLKGLPDCPHTLEPIESIEEPVVYRYKTAQEFEEEFGKDWKYSWANNRLDWVDSMDYLLGQEVETTTVDNLYLKNMSKSVNSEGWVITKNMITTEPLQ